jgi:hypothetical protein
VVRIRSLGLALFVACASCGHSDVRPEAPSEAKRKPGGRDECVLPEEVVHPTYTSDRLVLELRDRSAGLELGGMVIPPFEFEASTKDDVHSGVEMELTIHDPKGRTSVQRFHYSNMREQCDPYCDPVGPINTCGPRRCWMERFRPPAIRIDRAIYAGATPGIWTYVLRRLDTGDRVSVTRRLFESEVLTDLEACEALPVELDGFRRTSCRAGVVPLGTSTQYWGIKARYERGGCRVIAFALPMTDAVRTAFDEGPYAAGRPRAFPEGTVREVEVDDVRGRAWLAHHHFYVFGAPKSLAALDGIVRAMLDVFPVVDGPVRAIPACEATGAVTDVAVTPSTMEALRDQSSVLTHFEGNRPSGIRLSFHDRHPLARAGLRRNEILHAVDGRPVRGRREIDPVLERLTKPGALELVVARTRMERARCVRITVGPAAATIDAPRVEPPPPRPPQRGRHCERRTDACWDCVDIAFPAELGCSDCPRGRVCVGQGGQPQCLAPTRVCCMPGVPCEVPPGCDGAASSCSSNAPSGRNERCTFLTECRAPLPR